MDESEFIEVANHVFSLVEDAIDCSDLDVETVREGNIITLECEEGDEIVINMHTPTAQLWMASRRGGLHFEYIDGQWISTRSKEEFWSALNRLLSTSLGRSITLQHQ